MEAFGNAKTLRNDNSSRFGKYIDIHFTPAGVIEGAKIQQYLLEKSRIVHQASGERNYHIFYRLLAGLSKRELEQLYLSGNPKEYHYISQGNCYTCEGMDEKEEFALIRGGMQVLNFDSDHIWNVFKIIAAVLNLGNVNFLESERGNMPVSTVKNKDALRNAAALLEVSFLTNVTSNTDLST